MEQTIDICADVLYHNNSVDTPWLPESSFHTLMSLVTTGVEFSFDNVMYRQVDGVAMRSPLGPVLANIFVGYCESLADQSLWPEFYVRFVDDLFTYFDSVQQCDAFLNRLNNLHPYLKFTVEHEQNNTLSFVDVRVEKSNDEIVTSIYRKPTFTGQYIVFDSYCSYLYKVNLVKNLVDRARRICSPSRLKGELPVGTAKQATKISIKTKGRHHRSKSLPSLPFLTLERRGITDIVPHDQNASYTNILCGVLHPCVHYDTCVHGEEGCPTIPPIEPLGLPI